MEHHVIGELRADHRRGVRDHLPHGEGRHRRHETPPLQLVERVHSRQEAEGDLHARVRLVDVSAQPCIAMGEGIGLVVVVSGRAGVAVA